MPQALPANTIGSPFIELQSVDSTNNYAREQLPAGNLPESQEIARHGQVFFAHEQRAGKGQRGKSWTSEKGSNIAMSIVIDPRPLSISQQFQLSACVAVAVHEFFLNYAGEEAKIKWPNDLYWQDRKAGGILIESVVGSLDSLVGSAQADWLWAIVGIGININQTVFPVELPNPVSLKQITGKHFDPVELAKKLSGILDHWYTRLIRDGFEEIYTRYNDQLYKRGALVKLKKENRVFEARIKKISTAGKLITEHAIEEEFDFGEIEWVQ